MAHSKKIRKVFNQMDYNYYVYVKPGHIEYFNDLDQAQEIAKYYGTNVSEI